MPPNDFPLVTPAHPAFLAIYNPSLGATDETLHDQIVYCYSKSSRSRVSRRARAASDNGDDEKIQEDENERLRQIGLAQGMRIDLTRLASEPSIPTEQPSNVESTSAPPVEYSSREVSPPYLLRQQLQKAHSIFLLHHASSLDSLYNSLPREGFYKILDRFWTKFVLNWDVLLHGNPAVEILNGIKLAGCGELGIGVGEEEWGSGEREVLEGFVSRTDGLVDMILSRFGDPEPNEGEKEVKKEAGNALSESLGLGGGTHPAPSDGVVFLGTGKIAAPSLLSVSQWMEWIYRYGESAYGVKDDPRSARRRNRRREFSSVSVTRGSRPRPSSHSRSKSASMDLSPNRRFSPGIPPPLVVSPGPPQARDGPWPLGSEGAKPPEARPNSPALSTETFMKMITLGYGSAWGGSSRGLLAHPRVNILRFGMGDSSNRDTSPLDTSSTERGGLLAQLDGSQGKFIIGLRVNLENEDSDCDNNEAPGESREDQAAEVKSKSIKITSRTLNVNVIEGGSIAPKTLRVVVYLFQPFMFTFLFDPESPTLSSPTFYRSLHHQLGPLQKPLLSSTCPSKAAQRLSHHSLYHGFKGNEVSQQHIYDVVSDPSNHTVRASLPNIPEPGSLANEPDSWSRVEALNVHTQILNTFIETRFRTSEIERTCKTSRGWWVLWMRLNDSCARPNSRDTQGSSEEATASTPPKEAFLICRTSDSSASGQAANKGLFRNIAGSLGDTQKSWIAPGKLAEGIGLDAKRYIETLLSLNR
ncbi:predicted protein [Uncinocarpus reesii 1704]|uniref:CCZ1/INTU/HSP4 first Longin domain-containing protein n=1 Tax=Uncinocarpus reesii (strain UAMH 1704) TaxID=336963 RepID=C4JJW0_UNCRE|nr:uncharacterized protein UREG_01917 [Uncinocarpus reesii 1704]EEP77068.1 predicted protein [Uncinocarpus reesii 1704]